MESIVCYTEEIDDLNEAVKELFEQADALPLKANSLGILYPEDEVELDELYDLLSEKWDFPIIGCTSLATFTGDQGLCQGGISLVIFTADDCQFSAGITEELTYDNYKDEISRVYNELKAQHDSEIKLVISYGGMAVAEGDIAGDDLVFALNEVCDGVPVYGGTAADDFSFTGFQQICNRETRSRGQVLALISGNINPRFAVINSIANRTSFSYEVTKSDKNKVYKLGGSSFVDTLKRENMENDKTEVLTDYILSPFLVQLEGEEGDTVEVARNLSLLDHEGGAGGFLGAVPEGSILKIGLINREDVQNSVEQAFEVILKEIAEDKSVHTLLCNSCAARFLAMASNTSAEAQTYEGRIPEGVSLLGLYSYGEYCPVKGSKTGNDYNLFHNFTFTIMAV